VTRRLVRLALAGFALVAVVPAFAAAQGGPVPGGRCIIEFEGSQGANITRTGELVRALNGANQWNMIIERGGRRLTLSVEG